MLAYGIEGFEFSGVSCRFMIVKHSGNISAQLFVWWDVVLSFEKEDILAHEWFQSPIVQLILHGGGPFL